MSSLDRVLAASHTSWKGTCAPRASLHGMQRSGRVDLDACLSLQSAKRKEANPQPVLSLAWLLLLHCMCAYNSHLQRNCFSQETKHPTTVVVSSCFKALVQFEWCFVVLLLNHSSKQPHHIATTHARNPHTLTLTHCIAGLGASHRQFVSSRCQESPDSLFP